MRENIENDGLVNYTLFGSSNFVGQSDDVAHDLIREVVEFLVWNFLENTPRFGVLILQVIETELQGSSSNHTLNIYEIY